MGVNDITPVDPVEPPDSIGVTRIEKHDQCPMQFYFTLRDGGSAQTAEMTRGSAFHAAVEEATVMALEQNESEVPFEVVKALYDGWLEDHPELCISQAERDAGRVCCYHWATHTRLNPQTIIGVEVNLEMVLPRSGVTIRGFIDLLERHDDVIEVNDYKTQLNILSDNDAANHFQIKLYCALTAFGTVPGEPLPIAAGINQFKGRLIFPRRVLEPAPYREPGLATATASWSRSELQVFVEDIDAAMLAMQEQAKSGKWPARAGSHCKYCPAWRECPIPERLKSGRPIRSLADAEAAAEKLYVLTREKDELQKEVKQWIVDTESPILFGTDQAYDLKETSSKSVDWRVLEVELRQSVEFGEPFNGKRVFKVRSSNRFTSRKQTEDERGR